MSLAIARTGDEAPHQPERNVPPGDSALDQNSRRIRDWLFLLLCFAVTREQTDETAALRAADAIDSLGRQSGHPGPTFFRRTTAEVCEAIAASDGPHRRTILGRHLARIEDPRLRRVMQAACDLEPRPASSPQDRRQYLWSGL